MPPTLALQQMDADVLASVLVAADWLVARMERNGCAAERAVPPLRASDPPRGVQTFQAGVAISTGGSIIAAHQLKTHNKASHPTLTRSPVRRGLASILFFDLHSLSASIRGGWTRRSWNDNHSPDSQTLEPVSDALGCFLRSAIRPL